MGRGMRSAVGLLAWTALCFAAAWFGARYAPGPGYEQLIKPAWTPPPWLFAPVWTALYLMMALAAWLVWLPEGMVAARRPLGLFLLQLVLNGLWSWLFFGLQRRGIAFADVLLLWCAILATAVAFWGRRPLAGLLLVPYLLWVGFAAALNLAIWRLNM
ncbi:MAG: TspO/MBR family protein [Gammaproteobacteria bacterium]